MSIKVCNVIRFEYADMGPDTRPWWLRIWHRLTSYPWSLPIRSREEAQRLADAALADLEDVDPLRDKLDELEREALRRDCPHEHTVTIATHDRPHDRLCQDCGAILTED